MTPSSSATHRDGHRAIPARSHTVQSEIRSRSGRIGFRDGNRRHGHSGRVSQRGHGLTASLWRFYG